MEIVSINAGAKAYLHIIGANGKSAIREIQSSAEKVTAQLGKVDENEEKKILALVNNHKQ